jgi:hypothetical protein
VQTGYGATHKTTGEPRKVLEVVRGQIPLVATEQLIAAIAGKYDRDVPPRKLRNGQHRKQRKIDNRLVVVSDDVGNVRQQVAGRHALERVLDSQMLCHALRESAFVGFRASKADRGRAGAVTGHLAREQPGIVIDAFDMLPADEFSSVCTRTSSGEPPATDISAIERALAPKPFRTPPPGCCFRPTSS